jgi:hypothetical protein
MKKVFTIVLVVVALLVIALAAVEYHAGSFPGEIDRLQSRGKTMVQQLESFRAERGVYPSSLDEAGVVKTSTRFGNWEYQSFTNGFRLTLGDYSHAFILGYDSSNGWWRDT